MRGFAITVRALLGAAAVFSAQAAAAAQIVVGQVAPLTGLEASQGRAYGAGMQLHFNAVNQAGGVNGHTFKLVREDDGGRAEDTVARTRELLARDKPLVLAGYFGNRNLRELLAAGLLARERIALVGYRAAEIPPDTPHLYNVRASTGDEVRKMAEHLATIGITRLGIFYEEGPGAQALLAQAEDAAKKARASIVVRGSHAPGSAQVAKAVDSFIKAAPQAIILVSSGSATAGFIEEYRANGGAAQLFAHSGADIEQMSRRLSEEQLQGIAIAQVTPNPYKVTSRLVKEFNDLAARAPAGEAPLSYAMMEGYIAARLIVEAVRRQGAAPTREGMARAIESLGDFNLGGYALSFAPGRHSGSKFVDLTIVSSSGRIRQ